ncbi:MAG: response regulator [Chloroflexi bacterium]|nr:response regulator [Chloroflexota bacterium]
MRKLLIADDDPTLRNLVRTTLQSDEYEILEAGTGNEALAVARAERPQLVLLDVQMPGLTGVAVCRELKADPETRDTIVVMLTSRSQEADLAEGRAAGADEYLTKPFSPLRLLRLVESVLRLSAD